MKMNVIDDSVLFEEKGYKLDALIMTSFTEFDIKRVENYIWKAGSTFCFDYNRMWLFQCNPVKNDESSVGRRVILRRVFKPNCKKDGKSITCGECLKNCLNGGNGIPQKVFHPKVWLLRFVNKEDEKEWFWKLVVSSKNMSGSAEKLVDCYFHTKGSVIYINQPVQSNDLTRMLEDLKAPDGRQDKLNWDVFDSLLEEIKQVTWDPIPNFLYINGKRLSSWKNEIPWEGKKVDEMLVLSPFLNKSFVQYLFDVCTNTKIYSNAKGFSSLDYKSFYKFRKNMYEMEFEKDNNNERKWHAKIFVWKTDGKWYMLLGSLNATKKAFTDNTEFGVWFEIAEEQKPDWNGDTPVFGKGDEVDEAFDREIDKAFSETGAVELSPLDQRIYKEIKRTEFMDQAKKKILDCVLNRGQQYEYTDFESALLCQSEKNDYDSIKWKIEKVLKEYEMLNDDNTWSEYVNGCKSLLDTLKNMKEKINAID